MMRYEFLVLSLLFSVPGVIIWALRRDLRPVIHRMILASLPFALTEWLFYPEYWSPRFLFDLVSVIGFGVEDLIFVAGLGAFTSTAYAFVSRRRYESLVMTEAGAVRRAGSLCGGALLITGLLLAAGVAMIFATILAMAATVGWMLASRRDLAVPALSGGVLAVLVYGAICLIFAAILPGVFQRIWHTEGLWNRFILGVPLEELAYGFLAGAAATAFYPYAFGRAFRPPGH